ncbi:MAG: hypothetical protein IT426_11140 [Pirellulales bacterium]|nr:hypothetical protein [Pirellulales bacterium]
MNPIQKNLTHAEGDQFDRLADGELSESERRALLTSLDAEPEGWRRCALAFLEAQAWGESFGELTPALGEPAPLPALDVSPRPKKQKKPLGPMGTVMAMAASFLLALGLGGWLLRSPGGGAMNPAPDLIAGNIGPRELPHLTPASAGGGESIRQPEPSSSTPWQMVKLHAPGLTGNNEPLQLPALPCERLDEDFLKSVPNPLPDAVLQALERTGHEVRTHRELLPVKLKDGRQLVVPVDRVDVRYDNHRAY